MLKYFILIEYVKSSTTESKMERNEKPLNIQRLDTSLDPTKEDERKNQIEVAVRSYNERFGSFDIEKSYQPLFELLWYSQMPCTDVKGLTSEVKDELSFIKKCYWKKKEIDCNAVFQKRPTDRGMCCTFNMKKAENILKGSKYKDAIALGQSKDSQRGFRGNEDVRNNTRWFINNEPNTEPGIGKGLTLVVDAHSNRISSASVFDNFHGFPIIVEDNTKFPMTGFSGKRVRPGYENNIEVTAISLKADDEIRKYDPKDRKCYFPDEFQLKMHKNYSRSSCIFECEIEFAAKCLTTCQEFDQICNCQNYEVINVVDLNAVNTCVPWYYPSDDKEMGKFCNPWSTEKFKRILEKEIPRGLCKGCLPDCSSVQYETTMTSAELQTCDVTATGSTGLLCNIMNSAINPAPWITVAQNEYRMSNQTIPWYLATISSKKRTNSTKFSDKRARNEKDGTELFSFDNEKNPEYDAFKQDIAIVNVFFGKKEMPQFETTNRMSTVDFMYQIGGSLGFLMGISIVSLVEIAYWLFFRVACNLVKLLWVKSEMIIRLF